MEYWSVDQWPIGLGTKALFFVLLFFSSPPPLFFLTKRRRESNANRQAVAKIFSFSPSHSFSLVFFSISFRPKRQPKNLSEEITRRVDNIQRNTCADVI
jgi:hypothetical protein